MQKTYYRYNEILLEDFSDENNIYVYKCIVKNKLNSKEEKSINIVMKLKENISFEMSFEVI